MQNRLAKLGKSSQQENFHRVKLLRKILNKISMCGLWQVPANFNCSVPRSVSLTGIFTVKVPNIASIKGTTISSQQITFPVVSRNEKFPIIQ